MAAVANIFDMNSDGFIDYYEFVSALHPSRDPYRKTLDADQINEEVRTVPEQCIREHADLPNDALERVICCDAYCNTH